jgi:hypothetical protein
MLKKRLRAGTAQNRLLPPEDLVARGSWLSGCAGAGAGGGAGAGAEAGASRKPVGPQELPVGVDLNRVGNAMTGLVWERGSRPFVRWPAMHANGSLWYGGMAGAACMALIT